MTLPDSHQYHDKYRDIKIMGIFVYRYKIYHFQFFLGKNANIMIISQILLTGWNLNLPTMYDKNWSFFY